MNDREVRVTVVVLAIVLTGFAVHTAWTQYLDRIDFSAFYRDGVAWNQGDPLYTATVNKYLNTNPPTTTVWLFAMVARLPYRAALITWWLASAASLVAALAIIGRALGLSRGRIVTAGALLLLTEGAFRLTFYGQVTWLLLLPATLAWRALRTGRPVVAGCWLAPVIALKPPVAVMALFLPLPVWLTGGSLAAAMSGVTVVMFGWEPWRAWLQAADGVTWLGAVGNTSLWGIAARFHSGDVVTPMTLAAFPPLTIALVLVCAIAMWRHATTQRPDQRVICAVLGGMFLAPLAWPYYAVLGLGAFIAAWPAGPGPWLVYAMTLPVFVLPLPEMLLAAIYPASMLAAWFVWTGQRHVSRSVPNRTP